MPKTDTASTVNAARLAEIDDQILSLAASEGRVLDAADLTTLISGFEMLRRADVDFHPLTRLQRLLMTRVGVEAVAVEG